MYIVSAAVASSAAKAGSDSLKTKEEAAKAADMDPARSDTPAADRTDNIRCCGCLLAAHGESLLETDVGLYSSRACCADRMSSYPEGDSACRQCLQ